MGGSAYLIRHGRAGRRSTWEGPDELRPLSGPGRRQAKAIARLLRDERIGRIVSSPFARCVQTVEPLAAALGLPLEEDPLLAEGVGASHADQLARSVADGAGLAMSSHGDIVLALLDMLAVSGVPLTPGVVARKGSIWILDVEQGAIARGRYVPPPGER